MKNLVICYHTNTPVYYNKGTEYEKTRSEFLAYYFNGTREEAEEEVRRINTEKPERLYNGEPAECDERVYYVDEQEEMY